MDEIPKYKKKKPQKSKANKRADHKHQYVKTISIRRNIFNHNLMTIFWSTHCSICGRFGEYLGDDDFKKPEYKGVRVYGPDIYLPVSEILEMYPDVPVYSNPSAELEEDVRIR